MKFVTFLAQPLHLSWWAVLCSAMPGSGKSEVEDARNLDTDATCLVRVARGDPDALQPIFDRWKLPLLSYFYRSLGSRADAEDLTLQTFERVYRAADRYKPEFRFSTWLFSIARRELLHELRRRRRKPVAPVPTEELALLPADTQASSTQIASEMEEQLLEALQELPERQRTAVLLAAAGDLSHSEIAGSLQVSESNLNVILHRARHALRTLFRQRQ